MGKENRQKAYQLKAALKKASPPTWCRCIIPAGITFSQLSLLLHVITGEKDLQAFEFEFYHEKVRLFEEHRVPSRGADFYYDFMGAFETFVDDLLDTAEWFSFNYGSGNSYRVTVEERIDERAESGACVLKYKGEWPSISEQEINQVLKEQYLVSYGEPDFRMSRDIQAEIEQGKYGLQGAKKVVSKTEHHKQSANNMLKVFAEEIMNHYNNASNKQMFHKDSLKSYLESDTKEKLKCYADELGIRHYSYLNKVELEEKIVNHILSPSVMKKRMCTLTDEQIAEFEIAIRCGNYYRPKKEALELLDALYDLDYIIIYSDDSVTVPDEVIEAYKTISTPEFHNLRRQIVWMQMCLEMHAMIYGIAPVEIVHRMYRRRPGYKMEREEFLHVFQKIPDEVNLCVIKEGKIIQKEILKNNLYLQIERSQGDKAFYIPGYQEVMDCIRHQYPSKELAYQELKRFLTDKTYLEEGEAVNIVCNIWRRVSLGYDFSDVMDMMNERNIFFSGEQDFMKFANIMMNVNNRTRMLSNRGYMPDELAAVHGGAERLMKGQMPTIVPMSSMAAEMLESSKMELQERGISVDLESNAREISSKKIYPNDPCPCGSGKKYKKCCGKN